MFFITCDLTFDQVVQEVYRCCCGGGGGGGGGGGDGGDDGGCGTIYPFWFTLFDTLFIYFMQVCYR